MQLTVDKNFLPRAIVRIEDKNIPLNDAWTFQFPEDNFKDNNEDDTLTYSTNALPTWLSFDAA